MGRECPGHVRCCTGPEEGAEKGKRKRRLEYALNRKEKRKKMYAIGIDIGTTSICGVVLDTATGKVVKSRTEMSNAFIHTPNPWEKIQDTDKVIALAVEILESFASYPAAVIGLTGQMHGIVYVDGEGRAVSPLYTWQDGRGNLPYEDTTYAGYLGSFAGYGNVTDFYNRVNHIRPEAAVGYCTIMDYLGMVLCGRKIPRIHTTNAASLGCFDLKEKRFHYDVEVEISDGFDLVGTYKGVPVSVAIGDNQASVFSTLADERDLLVNVGTGSQISIISDSIKQGETIETRPYFDGKYLVVGAALCGGRAYSLLKDFYAQFLKAVGAVEGGAAGTDEDEETEAVSGNCKVDVYDVMNRMLADRMASGKEVVPDRAGEKKAPVSGLRVDTRFAGTRQQSSLCGQISGITVDNFTPANLTYGFLDGMMEELYQMYAQMGEHRRNLVGSGNGIRKNQALVKIAEQKFGGQLRIPAHTEEAAYGAALFGLVACGAFESAAQVQQLIRYTGGMGEPIFFERNRVWRVYTGGKLFEGMFGDEPVDNFYPEEWIASSVKALNKDSVSEAEGLSRPVNSEKTFDALLQEAPEEMLGSKKKMRILVKILDSAVRLPAQAHPDKAYSEKYFYSEYGKTESWLILDTRPEARLYFGFKEGVDREKFSAAIEDSLEDKDAMERLMEYRVPRKGDFYFVPARTIHAIGAGCLILEVQEPTDFTIQPEHWCADYALSEQEMYLGLTKEQAVDCFDFTPAPDTRLIPEIVLQDEGVTVENLIGPETTDCFVINRIRLTGGSITLNIPDSYGVYIVTEGTGVLEGEGYSKALKKGDYFFLPACTMGKLRLRGRMECVECW